MPTETQTWPQKARDRIAASQMLNYITDVIDGNETEPDRIRLDACYKALNKVLPDLRAIEHSTDPDSTFEFHAHIHNGKG